MESAIKLFHASWEGKVPEWKECPQCNQWWTPISIFSWKTKNGVMRDPECPDCRGEYRYHSEYGKPIMREVHSKATIELVRMMDAGEKSEDIAKAGRVFIGMTDMLLRCPGCSRYFMHLLKYCGKELCNECIGLDNYKKMEFERKIEAGREKAKSNKYQPRT